MSAHIAPGGPNAVRVADARLAVVVLELIGGDDDAALGHTILRIAIGLVEHVDDELAVDLDRVFVVVFVEHQSTTKAALRLHAGSTHHAVGPNDGDPRGNFDFVVLVAVFPRHLVIPRGHFVPRRVEHRASGVGCEREGTQQ